MDDAASTMPEAGPQPAAAQPAAQPWRARLRHKRKIPLSTIPRPLTAHPSVIDQALDAFVPWHRRDYPGRWRAYSEVTGMSPHTLRAYRRRCNPTKLTLQRLDAFLAMRRAAIDAAMAALEAAESAIPEERRNTGLCAIDPATGLDKRHRGRKTKR